MFRGQAHCTQGVSGCRGQKRGRGGQGEPKICTDFERSVGDELWLHSTVTIAVLRGGMGAPGQDSAQQQRSPLGPRAAESRRPHSTMPTQRRVSTELLTMRHGVEWELHPAARLGVCCGSAAAANEAASARTAPRSAGYLDRCVVLRLAWHCCPPLRPSQLWFVSWEGGSYLARHRASRGRHERRRSRTVTWHASRAQHCERCRASLPTAYCLGEQKEAALARHDFSSRSGGPSSWPCVL